MPRQEVENPRCSIDEALCQHRERHLADDDEKCHAMAHDCCELVGLVADSSVMGDRDPSSLPDGREPFLVGAVRREVVLVPLHVPSGRRENVREADAKIAIGKENGVRQLAHTERPAQFPLRSDRSRRQGRTRSRRRRYDRRWPRSSRPHGARPDVRKPGWDQWRLACR